LEGRIAGSPESRVRAASATHWTELALGKGTVDPLRQQNTAALVAVVRHVHEAIAQRAH
jgi:hypothetical protein